MMQDKNFLVDAEFAQKRKGWKTCCLCNASFHSYVKTRKYCSHKCYVIDQKERIVESGLKGANSPKTPRPKLGYKLVCKFCGINFRHLNQQRYCENHKKEAKEAQVAKIKLGKTSDLNNKIVTNCLHCKKEFSFYKSRKEKQKFCSYECHLLSGGAWRAGMESAKATMKYGAKKDANHNEIVDALKNVGASVIDMSHVGRGFPDLIVGFASKTLLVEIKNPKTSYGKKGLNKNQIKWREQWTGGSYCVVDSIEAALRMIGVINEH